MRKLNGSRTSSNALSSRCLLILSFAIVLSGCRSTMILDCGIPRPNQDAIAEMLEEIERAEAGKPLLQPGVDLWHRDVFRSCDW